MPSWASKLGQKAATRSGANQKLDGPPWAWGGKFISRELTHVSPVLKLLIQRLDDV